MSRPDAVLATDALYARAAVWVVAPEAVLLTVELKVSVAAWVDAPDAASFIEAAKTFPAVAQNGA